MRAQASARSGGLAFQLEASPTIITAIAAAVADELERRGSTSSAPASPWLTVDETANYLRSARQRVYDLVNSGALEPARDGRRLLFKRDQLDAYLAGTDAPTSDGKQP